LFVSGIPPYCNETGLRNVFGNFGKIEKIKFFTKPTSTPFSEGNLINSANLNVNGKEREKSYFENKNENELECFKVAYILFAQEQSADKAMKYSKEDTKILSTKEHPIHVGFQS
jgi:RNA recognition motif-containing protein